MGGWRKGGEPLGAPGRWNRRSEKFKELRQQIQDAGLERLRLHDADWCAQYRKLEARINPWDAAAANQSHCTAGPGPANCFRSNHHFSQASL